MFPNFGHVQRSPCAGRVQARKKKPSKHWWLVDPNGASLFSFGAGNVILFPVFPSHSWWIKSWLFAFPALRPGSRNQWQGTWHRCKSAPVSTVHLGGWKGSGPQGDQGSNRTHPDIFWRWFLWQYQYQFNTSSSYNLFLAIIPWCLSIPSRDMKRSNTFCEGFIWGVLPEKDGELKWDKLTNRMLPKPRDASQIRRKCKHWKPPNEPFFFFFFWLAIKWRDDVVPDCICAVSSISVD